MLLTKKQLINQFVKIIIFRKIKKITFFCDELSFECCKNNILNFRFKFSTLDYFIFFKIEKNVIFSFSIDKLFFVINVRRVFLNFYNYLILTFFFV